MKFVKIINVFLLILYPICNQKIIINLKWRFKIYDNYKLNNEISDYLIVIKSAQGSILGPLLFIIDVLRNHLILRKHWFKIIHKN